MDPNNINKPTDHLVPTTPETSKKVKCDKMYQNQEGTPAPVIKRKTKTTTPVERRGEKQPKNGTDQPNHHLGTLR
jgi:hypothetical protein